MAANTIVFRKGARVGQPDAEADDEFLRDCFLNNGSYDQAADIASRQCILLGRTGSGKSAILWEVKRRNTNVVTIVPENLALSEITSSKVIGFFEAAGVHLDAFYGLLWKHILCVELLKRRFQISDEAGQRRFSLAMSDIFRRNKSKEAAVKYLEEWGDKFWLETEYRTSDLTRKLENKLEGSLDAGYGPIKLGIKGAEALTAEEKIAVIHHGQSAVSSIQIHQLSQVVDMLAEDIFPLGGDAFYVCIDDIDGDWVQDEVRFKLLKALLETIKSFQKVRSVKILVSMRSDLLFSLFKTIVSPGFQSEKFTGYNLQLTWTRTEIIELLNRRVQHLFRFQYSGQNVGLTDIIPVHLGPRIRAVDYIVERTFFRPREAIAFLNRCIEKAEGQTSISADAIKQAEYIYSEERLTALCDEWRREYPALRRIVRLVRGFSDGSEVGHLRTSKLEAICLEFSKELLEHEPYLAHLAEDAAMDAETGGLAFLQHALSILYQTSVIGLKLGPNTARVFSFNDHVTVDPEHITLTTKIYIHKAFWITLNITTNEFDTRALK